jgi:branched-chain amino acid aminotransferase
MHYTIINNELLPSTKASLLVNDLSIERGYGVFDYFKILNGKPIFLEDHLDRFYQSASIMQLPVSKNRDQLKAQLQELMQQNNMPDSGIRITLTGGYSKDGYDLSTPNLIITQQPLPAGGGLDTTGIHLVTYAHQRQLAAAKTIDYIMAIWLRSFIKQEDAYDVLYHHHNNITETPRTNFFIVTKDDTIVTASHHILKGVIRKQVLELAAGQFNVEERSFTIQELYQAKEAFITSTTKNIWPVVNVDHQLINDGKPGPITAQLTALLQQRIQSNL